MNEKIVTNKKYKDLSLKLAMAETEAAIDRIISADIELANLKNWVPFNQEEKNWHIAGNQQASPVPALTEKITNSIDAMLLRRCKEENIDPQGSDAPDSMKKAVKLFFNVPEGKLGNLTEEQRTNLADNIQIIITGDKTTPCYSIFDRGEGQSPSMVPRTFLSLGKKNKDRIVFVQGKYNMGGAGSLSFCGENFYQLIITRRHASLWKEGEDKLWSFTLVRRRDPRPGEDLPVIEYFSPQGKTACFEAENLSLLPDDNKNLYSQTVECGTFIKLYDYNIGPNARSVDFGLNNALSETLFTACLPIRLKDTRVERAGSFMRTFSGMDVRLESNKERYLLQDPWSFSLEIEKVGKIQVTALPLKERESNDVPWLKNTSAIYIRNGQMHAIENQAFLEAAGLAWLRKRLLVVADCTGMLNQIHHIVFMPSRDRMKDSRQAKLLRAELKNALKEHPGLKELNRRLHEEASLQKAQDESDIQDIFSSLVKSDPNMALLFDLGKKVITLLGERGTAEKRFVGKRFPSYLKPISGINEGLRRIPVGGSRSITAETDAVNDYLMRTREAGEIVHEPKDCPISCTSLHNGIANFRITAPANGVPGQKLKAFIGFMDADKAIPVGFDFEIELEAAESKKMCGKTPSDKPKPEKELPKPKEEFSKQLPKIIEVKKGDSNYSSFEMNETSGFFVAESPETKTIEIFINMSNSFLIQAQMKTKQPGEPAIIEKQYKIGMALMACSLWKKLKQDDHRDDIIKKSSSAISQVLLSAIRSLGDLSSNVETVGREDED